MKRSFALVAASVAIISAHPATAQEIAPGPGTLEVTVIPGGGTFYASKNGAPTFGNYTYGGTVTYNANNIVGVEGEVGNSVGIAQDLAVGGLTAHTKTPTTLDYSANVVVSVPTHSPVVPYVTGGVGGLTVFDRPSLGIATTDSYLTGNVGGGVKWYAPNRRWGLRGDYRFIALRGKDDGAPFLGLDNRYAHRVYGGIIINAIR
jgi:opacity protein-like surface antigen